MDLMKKINVLLIATLLSCTPWAMATKPVAAQLSHYINTHSQEQLDLLQQLVNINSGTTNLTGIHQVGELLRPQFKQLGFETQWLDLPKTMQRSGTLRAQRQGHSGKRLLLIAHLDTVFAKESPFQHFAHQGDFATGPGVIDGKGGIVHGCLNFNFRLDFNEVRQEF